MLFFQRRHQQPSATPTPATVSNADNVPDLKHDWIFKIAGSKTELLNYAEDVFKPEPGSFKLETDGWLYYQSVRTVIRWRRVGRNYQGYIPGNEEDSRVVRGPW